MTKKERKLKPSERIFSFSSASPPEDLATEMGVNRAQSPSFKRGSKTGGASSGTTTGRKRVPNKRKRLAEDDD